MIERDHPLGTPEGQLHIAIKQLRKQPFAEAAFWDGGKPSFFRYAKIVTGAEDSVYWCDANGEHPLSSKASKDANTVLRTIRNALAHGNVVYLDKNGHETPGQRLVYLAFLSRHEKADGYRVAIFDEESFLAFLKAWIEWLQTFPPERALMFAEAAE